MAGFEVSSQTFGASLIFPKCAPLGIYIPAQR